MIALALGGPWMLEFEPAGPLEGDEWKPEPPPINAVLLFLASNVSLTMTDCCSDEFRQVETEEVTTDGTDGHG